MIEIDALCIFFYVLVLWLIGGLGLVILSFLIGQPWTSFFSKLVERNGVSPIFHFIFALLV